MVSMVWILFFVILLRDVADSLRILHNSRLYALGKVTPRQSTIWMTENQPRSESQLVRDEVVIQIFDEEQYLEYTKDNPNGGIVVVEFQKGDCKPCKKAAPLFEALAQRFINRATFLNMDAKSGKITLQAMKKIGIKSVPTFYVFRNGERVDSISGNRVDDLESLIVQEIAKE